MSFCVFIQKRHMNDFSSTPKVGDSLFLSLALSTNIPPNNYSFYNIF